MKAPEAAVAVSSPSLARDTAAMIAGTGVSRGLGFLRAILMAAVLGPTFFGNTYIAAIYVPNIVFELVAAGALSAVLVPALVERLSRHDQRDAEELAGAVLGIVGLALALLAVVGVVVAPWIMRSLTTAVPDPEVRHAQVQLGRIFLWCFVPQMVLYAWAMVATAALHAQKRFSAPTLAPGVSSLVVIAVFAVYALVAGDERTLHPPLSHTLLLGIGTTAGVAALALTPAMALARTGFRLRPRLDWNHAGIVQLRRLGLWAGFSLAATQVLNVAALVIGSRVEGGLVVWQLAFTYFLLPHALFSQPIFTALFPRLAEQEAAGDREGRVRTMASGLRATAFVALPATAAYLALARPLLRASEFGRLSGATLVSAADTLAAFSLGLLAYGVVQLATRSCYARGDARSPGLATLLIAVVGVAAMVSFTVLAPARLAIAALAAGHSVGYAVGAVFLLRGEGRLHIVRPVTATALAATLAGAAAWAVANWLDGGGRLQSIGAVATGGAVLAVVYFGTQALRGAPELGRVRTMVAGRGAA